MYQYCIKLAHNNQKCEYMCSKYTQSEHTDATRLKFAQICSVKPVHSVECVPDVELFLESAHMNMRIHEHNTDAVCDTCEKAVQTKLQTVKRQSLSELWQYSGILYGSQESEFERMHIQELADSEIRLSTWPNITPAKSTHTQLNEHKPKRLRNTKKAADEYARIRGGFTFQQFEQYNLKLYQDNMGLCSTKIFAKGLKSSEIIYLIVKAINHHADDFRYVRVHTREPVRDVCLALFHNEEISKSLHSHPMLTFDEAVHMAIKMSSDAILLSHDKTINDALIASGLRSNFGITNIHTIIVDAHLAGSNERINDNNIKQCSILRLFSGSAAVDRVINMTTFEDGYISCDTISSLHDFRLTVTRIMRVALSRCVFVRDLCTVMLEVDTENKRVFNPRKEYDIQNIETKRRIKKWSDSAFRSAGIIVDLSKEMSLGDSFSCGDVNCKNSEHKHKTIVYIDTNSPRFVEHMHDYLNNIRHVANVCTVLSQHVKHGYMHIVYVLQQEDIAHIRRRNEKIITELEDEYRQTYNNGDTYDMRAVSYLSSMTHIELLHSIRKRQYNFLQLHGIQKFSFTIFSQIKDKYNERKIQLHIDKEYEYLFYIGHIDIHITSERVRPQTHTHIDAHMIRIVESDIRFKLEVISGNDRKLTCAELIKDAVVHHMRMKEISRQRTPVPLTVLSGYMHLQYSSIGATFSFVDDMPLRIYKTKDVRIPYIHENVDYIYYRAHSFAVTITGAFANILKNIGHDFEETHTCSCKSRSVKCDKCLHNVIFCERDTIVSNYISAKFEEIIPFITAMYLTYSFNGADTESCDLDHILFPDSRRMIKCGHSIEFLYHSDSSKIAEINEELKRTDHISVDRMNKIIEDEDFCLVLVEPINETYGEIKTSREDLYNAVLQLYYNDELRQQIMIPFFVENTFRTLWMNACMRTLLDFEGYIKGKILRHKKAKKEQLYRQVYEDEHSLKRYREYVQDKDLVVYEDIMKVSVEDSIAEVSHTPQNSDNSHNVTSE